MLRYRLDDLGWYQFEWLIQSLLKAKCGLGVESWGGNGDWGRDAYSIHSLNFPTTKLSRGPFIFQAKFVQEANAAGAKPAEALTQAIRKELGRIKERISNRQWSAPRHYVLLTNVSLGADLRVEIYNRIKQSLESSTPTLLGGGDVCDLLDQFWDIARSFPQLLSLRDLDQILANVVNRDILNKSRAAIDAAQHVLPVFVPTQAYSDAWKKLGKHHCVVLEGPPEMGKTAIAWTITTALVSQGWQGVVCDGPEDFFRAYDTGEKQVFVADDAFGRTEYDPTLGKKWERALERVFTQLNQHHLLIWTCRKHILERALKSIDLQGVASGFPKPSAILVDASRLSVQERALILYRHARAAKLHAKAIDLVKANARIIVRNDHFTPERIRRFVTDIIPELLSDHSGSQPDQQTIISEVNRAIQAPTERMRKSFAALDKSHVVLLCALLEAGGHATIDETHNLFKRHSRGVLANADFEQILDELSESFIRQGR